MTTNIVHTPDTCGGRARIDNTRLPVWVLENFHQSGTSDAELLDWYPTLTQDGLTAALEYAAANKAEIDKDLEDQRAPLNDDFKVVSVVESENGFTSTLYKYEPSRWNRFAATARQWFHLLDDIWRSVKRSVVDAVHLL